MKRAIFSPFLLIALLVSGFSSYLAYKEQYEAAMAGFGVAVAAAVASSSANEDEEKEESLQQKIALLQENERLKGMLSASEQRLELQGVIKEMEVKIARLQAENQILSKYQEMRLLPESKLNVIDIGLPESKELESLEEIDHGDESS